MDVPGRRADVTAVSRPELVVGDANGLLEHEAERVTADVMGIPSPDNSVASAPSQLNRECPVCEEAAPALESHMTRPSGAVAGEALGIVYEALDSPGRPLDPGTRAFFEPRFGRDFSHVRVHADSAGAASAEAVGARAYTVGPDVVFAADAYSPSTREGIGLIAHELTHVAQQAGNATVGRHVARKPAAGQAPVKAAEKTPFQKLWEQFVVLHFEKPPRLRAMLPDLVAAMSGEDAVTHGTELAAFLIDNGERELARDALARIDVEYRTRQLRFELHEMKAIEEKSADPTKPARPVGPVDLPGAGIMANPVDPLVERGLSAARAGDDTLAFELLTRAYLFLQMQLERAGPLEAIGEFPDLTRHLRYGALSGVYDRMRSILDLYPALARELVGSGDAAGAARARAAGAHLRESLRSDFLLTDAEVEIAEVSHVDASRGPALRIHGFRGEMDVTQLPGLTPPAEVGQNPYQVKLIEDVHAALEGQVDVLEDLLNEPGIRKAFPRGDVDMTNLASRMKVWKAIYESRKASGEGLRALMATVGRYLKAFTVHTDYNVRDFGSKSYIQDEAAGEATIDLTGRAERDCGVYALTVAYEVARTAKSEGIALDFELVTTLDHAMLVIHEASGAFYIVSNDTVSGPLTGSVPMELAKIAGSLRGRKAAAMPAMTFGLGSSIGSASKKEYSDASAWSTYKRSQFGLGHPGEEKEPLYKQYYDDQAELERLTWQLEAELLITRPPGTDEAAWLARRADELRPEYARLAFLWQQWGTQHSWNRESAAHGMTLATGPRTLARFGKLLLRRQHLGQNLNQLDRNVLEVCDAIPLFHDELEAYRAKGTPPGF
jgi:hypothetical protein